eukprot:tig00021127_g18854.t1
MTVPNATPGSGTRNWALAGSLIADAAAGLAGWVEQRLLRLAEERGGKEELERGDAAEAEGREAWPAHLRLGARLLGRGGAEAALLRGWAVPALDATVTLALLARCGGELGLAGGAAGEAAGALAEGRAMWGHSCRCPRFDAGGSHEPAALLAAALALYGACGLDGEPLRARFAAAAAAGRGGAGGGAGEAWRAAKEAAWGSWSGGRGTGATTWTPGSSRWGLPLGGAFGRSGGPTGAAAPSPSRPAPPLAPAPAPPARAVRAFLKEASLLRSVEHPNVVQCHGYSVGPGPPPLPPERFGFLVMDHSPHGDLRGYLARNPGLRVAERAGLARDVAAALAHLHSRPRPVIHCDLKPSNVLVSGEGRAQVCDFGLAKARIASLSGAARPASSASASGPSQGSLFGTLHYTAPEVFAFDSGREGSPAALLTPALDMYSFSMLLYEIFTGTEPWRDLLRFVPDSVISSVLAGRRPALPPASVSFPPAVRALLVRCWDQRPSARPSADEALRILEQEMRPAPPPSAPRTYVDRIGLAPPASPAAPSFDVPSTPPRTALPLATAPPSSASPAAPAPAPALCVSCGEGPGAPDAEGAPAPPLVAVTCGCRYCRACLARWILQSCHDISNMPPRCCKREISAKLAASVLAKEEHALFVRRYQAHVLEANAKEKMYCPVATCSAFVNLDSYLFAPPNTPMSCPMCRALLCYTCRTLFHAGLTCAEFQAAAQPDPDEVQAQSLTLNHVRCARCAMFIELEGEAEACRRIRCPQCAAETCAQCRNARAACLCLDRGASVQSASSAGPSSSAASAASSAGPGAERPAPLPEEPDREPGPPP